MSRLSRFLSRYHGFIAIAVLITIGAFALKDRPSTPPPIAPSPSGVAEQSSVQVVRGVPSTPQQSSYSHPIEIVDGDTIRSGGYVYRLVGFDTPETGRNARCAREQTLGAAATRRLTELVRGGGHVLARVPCACVAGTEGTGACNYGRLCARLTVQGRDVGSILIGEGLARPYVCGGTSCPPRAGWC
jgi:endonuclease YncB( thermonuclease family)